eukprot:CAMPEP_0172446722 /NCGR_PEP_ID=MMETSP1065-20121228/6263_1 /TAXON_ID=265537 /ORGANISM="Amphiprora paludosa, Strain CCMP125" /LENGTH=552 /DNA_ID=CAMNT_0013197911 /DNA_START=171 /DNA_END=1829 /DNA_ORIENTATION=+
MSKHQNHPYSEDHDGQLAPFRDEAEQVLISSHDEESSTTSSHDDDHNNESNVIVFLEESGDAPVRESSHHSSVALNLNGLTSKPSSEEDNCTDSTCGSSSRSSSAASQDQTPQQQEEDEEELDSQNMDQENENPHWWHDLLWLAFCFGGIMISFVAYGILLEYATSGDKRLAEVPFLFVTSVLGTITAYIGRTARNEAIADIPSNRFLILGLMSLGSTFCAIRALRYVIFPIQVLARSCKPVPVMLIGALLGKKYDRQKYLNVMLIVLGVALFLGGGQVSKSSSDDEDSDDDESPDLSWTVSSHHLLDRSAYQHYQSMAPEEESLEEESTGLSSMLSGQVVGVLLLICSLFFDGGTGAYEDKLMSMHKVEPFDLMFRFQFAKTILAFLAMLLFNEIPQMIDMLKETGPYILALGMCSAIGQVFIFITIAKFGALTTSLMSLTRKVTTLTASIVIFGHGLTAMQFAGLFVSVSAMLMNFVNKKKKKDSTKEGTDQSNITNNANASGETQSRYRDTQNPQYDVLASQSSLEDEDVERLLPSDREESLMEPIIAK